MKKILLILLIISISKLIFAENIQFKGKAIQSGFLEINVPENVKKIFFNEKEIPFVQNRSFVGFSRQDTLIHKIEFIFQDNSSQSEILYLKKREYDVQRIDNIPKKYTEQPENKELIERIQKEYQTISDVRKNIIYQNKNLYLETIMAPLEGKISSVFGSQRIINGKPKKPHFGIDFAEPVGTEIKACADGVVVLTGNYYYNGKFVLLDHGLGISSIYIHLDEISVHIGQKLEIGQKLGTLGNTGKSTGAHLHWGFYWFNIALDPMLILRSL